MNQYTQKKIIFWTFALVFFLGALEIRMFMQPPSTVSKAIAYANRSRLPAGSKVNENKTGGITIDVADEILDFKIPCKKQLTKIDAGFSKQIRFHYEVCPQQSEDYKITSVVNDSNSYQGTVFNLDNDRQTSDFIPLKEGPNHFKIVFTNSDHQKSEQDYIFIRAFLKTQAH